MAKKVKIKSILKNKFLIAFLVIAVAAGGAYTIINSSASQAQGGIDSITCTGGIKGWALDPDVPGDRNVVSIYIDGYSSTATPVYRQATESDHRFQIALPSSIKNGAVHSITFVSEDNAGDINQNAVFVSNFRGTCSAPYIDSNMSCNTSTGTLTGGVAGWSTYSQTSNYHFDIKPDGEDWGNGGWYRGPISSTSTTLSGTFAPFGQKSGTLTLSPKTTYRIRLFWASTQEHSPDKTFTTPPCTKTIVIVPPPTPKPPSGKATGGSSKAVARPPSTPTNPADTTKPTLPANLFAEQVGNGEVELTWDESTDAAGIDSYTVERSTDGIDWTILDDAVLINSYSDTTADFGVTYSYRVSAKDKSGNYSDYIQVDIETNSFSANIYADEDSTVTSEDDTVTVSFPAGSFSEDAYCEITKDTVKTNPKGYKLAAGGYIIECKNSQGDSISQLDKAAKVTMNLKSSKYKSYTAYSIDSDGKLEQIKSTFNSKSGELSFQISDLSNAFAAYGKSGGSAWWLWLIILLILILAVIAFIRWRRSRSESAEDAYYDSAGYVTMPPTAPVGPNGGGTGGYEQHTSLPDLVAQGQQQQQQPQQPYQEFPPAPPIQGQPGEFPEQDPNQYPPQPPTK